MSTAEHTSARPVWQRIADALRSEIAGGRIAPGARLPPERQLAEQYGASRVTTRRALAVLESEGLIRVEHGNGTFVSSDVVVRYRLGGDRIRFNQSLVSEGPALERTLLSHGVSRDPRISARLGLGATDDLMALETLTCADGHPIAHAIHWSNARRFAALAQHFKATGSITSALKRLGVDDYRRKSTEITARLPTPLEARHLVQSKLRPVLAYQALDVDLEEAPIAVVEGCFASDRVAVVIDRD